MNIIEKHDKAVIEAVEKLPETFTWKMLSKKLNTLGYWISPKTVRKRLTNGVVDVERIDIGLYRKNKVYFYENGDVVGQKPKTLEAIAEKSKRPLTISEIENTEHYKALEHKNELLQAVVDEFKKDLVNVGKLQWKLKDENETLQKDFVYYKNYHDGIQIIAKKYINKTKKEAFLRLIKNKDIQLSFWTGWLINAILTLIVSQVLK